MPTLKPFQEDDAHHLMRVLSYRRAAFLWNDMGTGKTPIAITVADRLEAQRRIVFCPAIARENWRREIINWQDDPLFPVFVVGVDGDLPPEDAGWVVVNYERIRNGNDALLYRLRRNWDIAIVDEHQYLSNVESQRTNHFYNDKAAPGGRLAGWWLKALLLSGTPMRNSPFDLYGHLCVWYRREIDGMDEEAFKSRYCHVKAVNLPSGIAVEQIVGGKNVPELLERIDGLYRRRSRTDPDVYAQLPPLMAMPWWQLTSGRAREMMDELADVLEIDPFDTEEDVAYTLENAEKHGATIHQVLEAIGLLHAENVADLVDTIKDKPGSKVLLFAHHKSVMDSLHLKMTHLGLEPVQIRGGQEPRERQREIDTFQNSETCRAAIVQLQVGATAVNLTAATDVIFVQMDWTAMNNVQCVARAYGRLSDPHPVNVWIVMSDDWLGKGQARVISKRISSISAALPGTIEHAIDAALHGQVSMDLPPIEDDWAA